MALHNIMSGWGIQGIGAHQMQVVDFPNCYKISAIAFDGRLNKTFHGNIENLEFDYREDMQTLVLFNNSDKDVMVALSAFIEVVEEDLARFCEIRSQEVGELEFAHFWPLIWTDDTVMRHTPYKITETKNSRKIVWER